MILSSDVYQTVLDITRKDLRGRSLSVEEFNRVARIVNELVFAKYYSEFESSQENSEAMSAFKVLGMAVAIGLGGIGVLPADYYHIVGMPWYTDTGGVVRYLDNVSSLEFAKRQMDYLTQSTLTHPTFRFGTAIAGADMRIYISPIAGINPIYIDYIRVSDVPFLDYYISGTTYQYTWMDAGATVSVPAGSTASNGTLGPANVVSTTINFEWDNEDFSFITDLFLQQLGITLPDEILYQGGLLSEQKKDNQ